MLAIAFASPAFAAVCERGKPVVPSTPLGDFYCQCFDKNPKGTQVFTFEALSIDVATPSGHFARQFSYDATTTCDADHLYVTDERPDSDTHAFPLRQTTIARGPGGDVAIVPQDQPNLRMIRLTLLGHARFIKTI